MKRAALPVYLLCLSAFFFAVNALNALTIPASEDSYTAPRNTLSYSTNNANALVVDANRKSYLYFDLSDIPTDAVVRWAKLRLFLPTVRTPGAGLSVHLVTGTWNESTRLADVPSIVAGSLGMIAPEKMASRRFVTVDVKDTVQKWINGGTLNEGFAIQPIVKAGSPAASVMLTSKEGPVFGLPAELDIEFQPQGNSSLTTQQVAFLGSYFGPTITVQPSAPVGSSAGDLTVSASGVGLLTYQWMRDGVSIAGATSATLATQGLQSGTYTVVVGNGFSSVISSSVLFVVPITPTAPTGLALVTGGTLPATSELGAVPVNTFYIGKTEVTWGEWQTVRTWAVANGYTDLANVGGGAGDGYPVAHANWYDVVKWCNARSEKEGKTPVYMVDGVVYRNGEVTNPVVGASANGYRLPSEAEWEFAARGGTQTNSYSYSGGNNLSAVGWYDQNAGRIAHEVGKKAANELGIFDMSGNMYEWTGDLYLGGEALYRVLRGGDWNDSAEGCAVAYRNYNSPENRDYSNGIFGFRVALNSVPEMVLVTGGTLPATSELGAVPVNTFYIGKTEVTWGEWQTVRTWAVANGYTDLDGVGQGVGDSYPVSGVNWYDVVKWCNARSEKEGKTPVYKANDAVYRTGEVTPTEVSSANGYRLPSEKEWEFAARGGTQTHGYTYSGSNNLNAVSSNGSVYEVGKKLANELGIFDMSGNLWEWSGSWYAGPESSIRVIRGGYWNGSSAVCAVAFRFSGLPVNRNGDMGFRVALSSVP